MFDKRQPEILNGDIYVENNMVGFTDYEEL